MAKFDAASFAVRKIGKFEIVSWEVDEVVDEIVVSGLAVVEQVRRQSQGVSAGC